MSLALFALGGRDEAVSTMLSSTIAARGGGLGVLVRRVAGRRLQRPARIAASRASASEAGLSK